MTFRFDLIDLQLFLNVVQGGSITAGAEASGLALPSASARVLAMEDSLGAPLLHRSPRGVQPTVAGQALLLQARALLLQMDRLRGEMAEHARGLKTEVRLLCNTVAMHEYIPDLLVDFLLAHPNVNLQLQELPGNEVVSALAAGRADVGIVRANTDVFELESYGFKPDRLVLVTPPDHPLQAAAQGGELALEQADDCDVIGLRQGTALQDIWDHRVAQRGRRLNYRVRVGSFDEQCRLIARGAGVAVMPLSSARRHAQVLAIGIVPLSDGFSVFDLRLCVRRLGELAPVTQRLVQALLGRDAAPGSSTPAHPAAGSSADPSGWPAVEGR